jgi:hypothetical protein
MRRLLIIDDEPSDVLANPSQPKAETVETFGIDSLGRPAIISMILQVTTINGGLPCANSWR